MRCRCFTGEYPRLEGPREKGSLLGRFVLCLLVAFYVFLYLRLEGFL